MSRVPEGWSFLVTAEHGGHDVPSEYRELFRGHEALLRSHRGWDAGTLDLAETLSAALGAPAVTATVTRLLVDLNRSAHNPRVFSSITRQLPRPQRAHLLDRFHRPHWTRARAAVDAGIAARGRVLHLGIHSFTPVLEGKVRHTDLALLYDPAKPAERELAAAWALSLARALPGRVVRRNDPYRGAADGMTAAFRRTSPASRYLGLEIEVNQKHVEPEGAFPSWVADALLSCLPIAPGR